MGMSFTSAQGDDVTCVRYRGLDVPDVEYSRALSDQQYAMMLSMSRQPILLDFSYECIEGPISDAEGMASIVPCLSGFLTRL